MSANFSVLLTSGEGELYDVIASGRGEIPHRRYSPRTCFASRSGEIPEPTVTVKCRIFFSVPLGVINTSRFFYGKQKEDRSQTEQDQHVAALRHGCFVRIGGDIRLFCARCMACCDIFGVFPRGCPHTHRHFYVRSRRGHTHVVDRGGVAGRHSQRVERHNRHRDEFCLNGRVRFRGGLDLQEVAHPKRRAPFPGRWCFDGRHSDDIVEHHPHPALYGCFPRGRDRDAPDGVFALQPRALCCQCGHDLHPLQSDAQIFRIPFQESAGYKAEQQTFLSSLRSVLRTLWRAERP